MNYAGFRNADPKQSRLRSRGYHRPVPGGLAPRDSQERGSLRGLWQKNRGFGHGAVVAAFADAARQGYVEDSSMCRATDPMKVAEMLFTDGVRRGWLTAA